MGEAKLRRGLTPSIPDDVKADIAHVVRSVNVVTEGGTCWFRQTAGVIVLNSLCLGVPVKRQFGSMIYRAGPHPQWDVVAFCSYSNTARLDESGYLGHAWIEVGDDLVDFTVGDWKPQAQRCVQLGTEAGEDCADKPITWTAPDLPDFFWRPRNVLKGSWKPSGEPDLGEAWYGPLGCKPGQAADMNAKIISYIDDSMDVIAPAVPFMLENAKHLRIKERLGE